jgi:hypothetical protein
MVDSEAISDASFVLAFRALLLDFVESCPPLRIRVLYSGSALERPGAQLRHAYLEGCRPSFCDVTHNDLWVVILEHTEKARQVGVAARLPGQVESVVGPLGSLQIAVP